MVASVHGLSGTNLRAALSWVIQDIHQKGWVPGTGGNFSAVLSRDPLRLLMAPSGVDKGLIQPEDLIEVSDRAQVLHGQGRASAETLIHLAIVETVGAGAVLHTHSVFNTLISIHYAAEGRVAIAGYEMLKGLAGIRSHDVTVEIPILPNTQDMQQASKAVRALIQSQHPYGFFLAGHGLYTWGKTLFEARRHLEILEFLCELTYRKLTIAG